MAATKSCNWIAKMICKDCQGYTRNGANRVRLCALHSLTDELAEALREIDNLVKGELPITAQVKAIAQQALRPYDMIREVEGFNESVK